jgi:hypothetical protein
MRFIPSEEYNIEIRKTKDEIIKLLHLYTELRENMSVFRFPRNKLFIGIINMADFRLIPGIIYGKSFRPVITGSISEHKGKCIINIKMQLMEYVVTFIIIWISFSVVFIALPLILGPKFSFIMLTPVIMLIYGYLIMYFGFRYGAKKARKKLTQILETDN